MWLTHKTTTGNDLGEVMQRTPVTDTFVAT